MINWKTLLFALSLPSCFSACGPAQLEPGTGARVVLISIDTLRADHLSCYGYGRETSPNIDALARESFRFERTYAQSNHTGPSHMTMLTGLSPDAHEVDHYSDQSLSREAPFLPAILKQLGYKTAAFGDGAWIAERLGFKRGFDVFDSRYEYFPDKLDRVEHWIRSNPTGKAFLFVHTYGAHAPYLPAEEHDIFTSEDYVGPLRKRVRRLHDLRIELGRRNDYGALTKLANAFWGGKREDLEAADHRYTMDLYDGCIRDIDAGIGRLMAILKEESWLDDSWVVLTSDHGEAFGEHGAYGHVKIHDPVLRVPLLIRPPGGLEKGQIEAEIARLLDVSPTILSAIGIVPPEVMQGESLLVRVDPDSREAFAVDGHKPALSASVSGKHKLYVFEGESLALWDLEKDPGENESLLGQEEIDTLAERMLERHLRMRKESFELRSMLGSPGQAASLNSEELELLRFLGYAGEDE